MACPNQGVIGESLTFTIRTQDANKEYADVDLGTLPTYTIYENTTHSSNKVTGYIDLEMVKDDDTTGLYYAQIHIDPILFDKYTTYIILITAQIDSIEVSKTYGFLAVGAGDVIGSSLVLAGDVNAVTDYKGSFKQGDTTNLLIKITNFEGEPIDPSLITCRITGPTEDISLNSEMLSESPYQVSNGYYILEWKIASDMPLGTYLVDWEYVIDNVEKHEYQNIVITSDVDAPVVYSERILAFMDALTYHLNEAQSIPVYFEQAKQTRDNQKFEFTFPRWNQSSGVRIYKNQEIVNSGVEINYFKGTVRFQDTLLDQDVINADYNFRWFSEEDLLRFLNNAVQMLNMYPPMSGYDIANIPDNYIPVVLYGAAKDAIRQLLMALNFQQPAMVFGGPDKVQNVFSNFETLKKNFEDETYKLLEQKKFGPYPRSGIISTPEYTLPGGRSRWFRYLFKG